MKVSSFTVVELLWRIAGSDGQPGVQGDQGDTGTAGGPGATGIAGTPGNMGPGGPAGSTGVGGPRGIQGLQGIAVSWMRLCYGVFYIYISVVTMGGMESIDYFKS